MLYKKIEEKKNMHSIRIYFGFNVLRSASKLKRGVIEKKWWVLLVFRIREFSFLQYFCCLFCFCRESWWGHFPWILFSHIYFTFFMIRLSSTFLWIFFPMWSSVFVVFLSLNPMSILHELLDTSTVQLLTK